MDEWGRTTYGDPCRECDFHWWLSTEEAVELVSEVPHRYGVLLDGASGSERFPGLAWPAVAYVGHVGDNLRIWAERLIGAETPREQQLAPYDADLLAVARSYDAMPVASSLWSLGHAVAMWREAARAAVPSRRKFSHPDRGHITVGEIVRSNAHDTHHHEWDLKRILGHLPPASIAPVTGR